MDPLVHHLSQVLSYVSSDNRLYPEVSMGLVIGDLTHLYEDIGDNISHGHVS